MATADHFLISKRLPPLPPLAALALLGPASAAAAAALSTSISLSDIFLFFVVLGKTCKACVCCLFLREFCGQSICMRARIAQTRSAQRALQQRVVEALRTQGSTPLGQQQRQVKIKKPGFFFWCEPEGALPLAAQRSFFAKGAKKHKNAALSLIPA
jgi:hypothetical protein